MCPVTVVTFSGKQLPCIAKIWNQYIAEFQLLGSCESWRRFSKMICRRTQPPLHHRIIVHEWLCCRQSTWSWSRVTASLRWILSFSFCIQRTRQHSYVGPISSIRSQQPLITKGMNTAPCFKMSAWYRSGNVLSHCQSSWHAWCYRHGKAHAGAIWWVLFLNES